MTTTTAKTENKTFDQPDETRTFELGKLDLVDIADTQIGRLTLQPGWRWSDWDGWRAAWKRRPRPPRSR